MFSVTGEIQVEVGKSYDNVLTATATDADTGSTLTYSLINAPQVGPSILDISLIVMVKFEGET